MPNAKVKLDSKGILAVLQGAEVAKALDAVAEEVAGAITATSHDGEVPVLVETHTTDRAKVFVTLAHPSGLGLEAKYGHLRKAAKGAGLTVKARSS